MSILFACISVHSDISGVFRDQEGVLNPLEPELQIIIICHMDLGNLAGRAGSALNHEAISSASFSSICVCVCVGGAYCEWIVFLISYSSGSLLLHRKLLLL